MKNFLVGLVMAMVLVCVGAGASVSANYDQALVDGDELATFSDGSVYSQIMINASFTGTQLFDVNAVPDLTGYNDEAGKPQATAFIPPSLLSDSVTDILFSASLNAPVQRTAAAPQMVSAPPPPPTVVPEPATLTLLGLGLGGLVVRRFRKKA